MRRLSPALRLCLPAVAAVAVAAGNVATPGVWAASLPFASTSSPQAWKVSTTVSNVDAQLSDFLVYPFVDSVAVSGRFSDEVGWIANTTTGTNSYLGGWTQFVFRQRFDLQGYDPSSARLSFQWAADDSGEGFASRGSWIPQYRLNGGALTPGSWPTSSTYDLGLVTDLSSGFVEGVNTIDFYVQGNGLSDGFALRSLGLTATPRATAAVPAPLPLLGAGAALAWARRLRRLQGRPTASPRD